MKIAHPELENRVFGLPNRIFSGRAAPQGAAKGVFFCVALPGLPPDAASDADASAWQPQHGKTVWLYVDAAGAAVTEGLAEIAAAIRSAPEQPRRIVTPREQLRQARDAVLRHIRQGYLKQMQAPPGVEPIIKAWMEIN